MVSIFFRIPLILFLFESIHMQYTPEDAEFWNIIGRERIEKLIGNTGRESAPKNIILFIGDGMGLPVLTGARVHAGMREGRENINTNHFFEDFPYSGLVKTSSLNYHTTDSAAGAVAYFSARKVEQGRLLTQPGSSKDCSGGEKEHINDAIPEMALEKGLSVGIVTTTRITHATPAASWAKGVNRSMESDKEVMGTNCTDIGMQMLQYPANQFTVILGGGSDYLLSEKEGGKRRDEMNVMNEWERVGGKRRVVRNKEEMKRVEEEEDADYLMGIFSKNSFNFIVDDMSNGSQSSPRLFQMTETAIKMLQKKRKGYFLMVEGGLIDWAEHRNQMYLAFEELEEFDKAIQVARHLTSSSDTLIIVTADHGHAVTLPGYVPKDRPIFETAAPKPDDKLPQTKANMSGIFFATGPGFQVGLNYTREQAKNSQFVSPSFYPLKSGAHGGEDVGLWADGPYARLLSGTIENTQVGYTIKYLLCLDENDMNICVKREEEREKEDTLPSTTVLLALCTVFSFLSFVFLGLLLLLRIRSLYSSRSEKDILG